MSTPPCNCGSTLERYPLSDARGIFVSYVCKKCEQETKARFRPEIFEDPHYPTTEPIDPRMTRFSGNQIFNALAEGDHPVITDTAIFIPAEEVALLQDAITRAFQTLLVPAAEYVPAIGDALDILKKAGAKAPK